MYIEEIRSHKSCLPRQKWQNNPVSKIFIDSVRHKRVFRINYEFEL